MCYRVPACLTVTGTINFLAHKINEHCSIPAGIKAEQIGSQSKHDITGNNPNRIRLNKLFSEFRKFNSQLKHLKPRKFPLNASLVYRSSK
jgi:hypothetical protein